MVPKRLLVTGGAGFIGSAFIRRFLNKTERMVNFDKLTYAGDLTRLQGVENDARYLFVQGDVCDQNQVRELCVQEKIDTIVHFAAESHVDRSILGPQDFLVTNVIGTFSLLEVVRSLPHIHFHHVSTDEVYGSLGDVGVFTELSPYRPNSPYAASKAASDHFVRAYGHTYGLSVTLSHCTNNYGPYQHPEKLIPMLIARSLQKHKLPLYGLGDNVRDWLHADDHVEALWIILTKGTRGEVYDIGGGEELSNLNLAHLILELLSAHTGDDYRDLITFVEDRPGHDYRYAIDASKMRSLGWSPRITLEKGLRDMLLNTGV